MPPTAAELAPAVGCCEQGGQCQPDPAAWAAPGWRELAFTIDDPHRFRYAYLPDPSGLGATVRAIGDLACDGAPLQIELKLTVVGGKLVRARTRGAPPP